ncbi:MAG: chromate transporter [Lawsonibacter sp.]
MLPILQREVVEKKGWATEEELTDYFAIGQCTPGIIAVNTAGLCRTQVPGRLQEELPPPWEWCFPALWSSPSSPHSSAKFATYPVVQHALARHQCLQWWL